MVHAKPPKSEAEALTVEQRFETPRPQRQSPTHQQADSLALRTVFLSDVPLLDSPEWSSDDELDNPTYNKRFRQKKHEKIRMLLQQKKLEERERQLQIAMGQRCASSQQPPTDCLSTSTRSERDQKHRRKRTSSDASFRADGQTHPLKPTKAGRSKQSHRSADSSRSRCTHHHSISGPSAVAGDVAEARTTTKKTPASPSHPTAPVAEMAPPPKVRSDNSVKSHLNAAAAQNRRLITTTENTTVAAVSGAPTPNTQAAPVTRPVRVSDSSPVSPSQMQASTATYTAATPSHNGAMQLPQELSVPILTPPYPLPTEGKQCSSCNDRLSQAVTSVAFFSAAVEPPKPHVQFNNLFVSRMVQDFPKGGGSASVPETTTSTAIAEDTSAVPSAPPLRADAMTMPARTATPLPVPPQATASVSAPLSAAVTHGGAPRLGNAAPIPAGRDASHPFFEPNLSTEERLTVGKERCAFPAAAADAGAVVVRGSPTANRNGSASAAEPAPGCSSIADEAAAAYATFVPLSPLSPPPRSSELQPARRRRSTADRQSTARSSKSTAVGVGAVAAVRPCSRLSSRSSCHLPSAQDKQLRLSGNYALSEVPSCFHYMLSVSALNDKTTLAETATALSQGPEAGAPSPTLSAMRALVSPTTTSSTTTSTATQLFVHWGSSCSSHSCDRYSSHREKSVEDDGEQGGHGCPDRGSETGADLLSPTNTGSDVDYILEYHSSYYGDLLRLSDIPISRVTFSATDDTERRSEVDFDAAEALSKLEGRVRRRDASTPHFHRTTDGSSISAPKDSSSSPRSSANSLGSGHNFFYSGEMHHVVTPPMYSFYTHLQAHRESEKKEKGSPLLSCVNFSKDPYALGVEDSIVMLTTAPSAKTAAEMVASTSKHLHNQNGSACRAGGIATGTPPRRGDLSNAADDADLWEYHRAKRESWHSLNKPPAGPAAGRERSSSVMSPKYSLLSSKAVLLQQETKAAKTAAATQIKLLPQDSPSVRILSLQGPLTSPLPQFAPIAQPTALDVRSLSLENPGSLMGVDSKSLDLLSPMVRKTTAPPEELTVMQEAEEKEGMPTAEFIGQPLQLPSPLPPVQQQKQMMFSFAGLQYHSPAVFQQKHQTAAASTAAPVINGVERPQPVAEAVHVKSHDDAYRQSPHDVYLPISGVEVDRFRSLIGSAYLTEVYTSSLRLLTGRRRAFAKSATGTATIEGHTTLVTSHNTAGEAQESAAKAMSTLSLAGHRSSQMHVPLPSSPQRNASLNFRIPSYSAAAGAVSAHSANSVLPTAAAASAHFSLPSFECKALARGSVQGSVVSSKATSRSPRHRYRRQHLITRIDALLGEEKVLRSSSLSAMGSVSASAVRAAAEGGGRYSGSHSVLQQASIQRRDGGPVPQQMQQLKHISGLFHHEMTDTRTLEAPGLHCSVVPVRSSSSFLRIVAAPMLPSPSSPPLAGCTTKATKSAAKVNRDTAKLPAPSEVAEVPLSVKAVVNRMEANVNGNLSSAAVPNAARPQKLPLAVRPSTDSASPPVQFGDAAPSSTTNLNENNRSTFQSNASTGVLPSIPRHLINHINNCNSYDSMNQTASADAAAPSLSALGPIGPAVVPKQATPSPVRSITDCKADPPPHENRFQQRSSMNAHHDEPIRKSGVLNERVTPPSPRVLPAQRLTREALMRQQLLLQKEGFHSQLMRPPTPQHTPHATATRQKQPKAPGSCGQAGDAAGVCRTTEDLLTRITVMNGTRGWRGGDLDFAIASTLGSSSTAGRQAPASPNASGTARDGRAALKAAGSSVKDRLTMGDGTLNNGGIQDNVDHSCRLLRMAQFSCDGSPLNT
ncbi:hypothetical protein ABL78_5119 [Leptomonas seymouri]|uniref:Uncharacterized protein n=1 Tax=Leptomonas seymouri TaxID=5684 RepID=A0A0N1I3W6_LEPSE|nr:hypothetical protein ABL78_5119 [Leptomonas seymouri]|eukprot:KPI85815.1 hypothetical protein ABL78_5119 [Leptomonas seymouri]